MAPTAWRRKRIVRSLLQLRNQTALGFVSIRLARVTCHNAIFLTPYYLSSFRCIGYSQGRFSVHLVQTMDAQRLAEILRVAQQP
jgi:hypothetical protein